jgi:hypothetical protein
MPDENKPDSLFSEVLHKLGVTEYFQKFRFGGFVGKLCVLGGVGVVVMGGVALRLHDDKLIFAAVVVIAILAALIVFKVSDFANKHPELAMFEGAEILQWEQMKLAAKGVKTPLVLGKPIPDPESKPALEDSEGEHS